MIEVDGFQGESVFNKILGKIPESGLETRKGDTGEPDVCYSYEGILGEQLNILHQPMVKGFWSETMSRKFHWKTKKS